MTSLSQVENEITDTRKKLTDLENKRRNLKIVEILLVDENEIQRTSNIDVKMKVFEYQSQTDKYGYSKDYKLTLTYEYTNVIFKTTTKVVEQPVTVELNVVSYEEQTYECRYFPYKECQMSIKAIENKSGQVLYDCQMESVEDGLEYNKANGSYLYIVDYILSQVECNDDWGNFIKKLYG